MRLGGTTLLQLQNSEVGHAPINVFRIDALRPFLDQNFLNRLWTFRASSSCLSRQCFHCLNLGWRQRHSLILSSLANQCGLKEADYAMLLLRWSQMPESCACCCKILWALTPAHIKLCRGMFLQHPSGSAAYELGILGLWLIAVCWCL